MALDAAKTICDTGLTCWDRAAKYRKYIRTLGDNLNALESKMADLDRVFTDVNRLVETAEGRGWIRTSDADGWLKKVESLEEDVGKILACGKKVMQRNCLCGLCYWNCRSRYKQSSLAESKKVDLENELVRGRDYRAEKDVAYEPADLILKRSLEALRNKMDTLGSVFETVKQRVESEEKIYQVRTHQVDRWLERVEVLDREVQEILKEGEREMGKSGQSEGVDSQCQRISRDADEKKVILEENITEGRCFTIVTTKRDDPIMLEIPSEPPVGREAVFREIWGWVEDETVRCIGLTGMGGVGKTTLLDRVHNQFLQVSHNYDFSFRHVVSRPLNLNKIQEALLNELKLPKDQWSGLDGTRRASLIRDLMKKRNFLLFLDDLWDSIDLHNDIGIPIHDHPKKYKIMFTTRDEKVCNGMRPDERQKVECLPEKEALELFRKKLGEGTWNAHPGIPKIAKSLVHECKYLPLALITVARAMTGVNELTSWMDAENDLKGRMSRFTDINEKVLAILEFSYINLPDEAHKSCFLYLSIFPEDHLIEEDDAIGLWIGEGFLDKYDSVHEAREYGKKIFTRLKDMCLVEAGRDFDYDGRCFKLHDVVREMAVWVYTEHGSHLNRVLAQEKSHGLVEPKKWEKAERIFCGEIKLGASITSVSYSNLSSLIIESVEISSTEDDFFLCMPCLRVLQLSCCYGMRELPRSIWDLINLRYLMISADIRNEVPMILSEEMKKLNKLVVLILWGSIDIPRKVLSYLSSLRLFHHRMLSIWQSNVEDVENGLLENLQLMRSVEEISIELRSLGGLNTLLGYPELLSCLRGLDLDGCHGSDSFIFTAPSLGRLESLRLVNCKVGQIEISEHEGSMRRYSQTESRAPKPSSLRSPNSFRSLVDVDIHGCHELVEVTSLIYCSPHLKTLSIFGCDSLKEVIVGMVENIEETNSELFPCLAYLELGGLPSLERICRGALTFPSLKELHVGGCPKLKELPLNSGSAKDLQVIKGMEEWWQGLEWNDPAAKQVFSTKFSTR